MPLKFLKLFRFGTKMSFATDSTGVPTKKATFGMACFWGPDSIFGVINGVLKTKVGYTGGKMPNPTYKNLGDHTEAILIEYDPSKISYSVLLDIFWKNHHYHVKMEKQYTSLILYHDEEQKQLAEASVAEKKQTSGRTVYTEVIEAGPFYDAEDYHQKYRLRQHPSLCKAVGLKTADDFKNSFIAARLNGYVYGQGNIDQFDKEVEKLGIDEKSAEYVRSLIKKYEGQALAC